MHKPSTLSAFVRVIVCGALILFLAARCAIGQNPPARAQIHDTRPNAGQYRVEAVIIRGNRQLPASTIRKTISIHAGDLYDPAKVRHDVAALKDTGYFDDVRAVTDDDPTGTKGGTVVIFYVREKDELVSAGTPSSPPAFWPDEPDKVGEQYKHASELLWAGELKEAQSGFEAVLQKKANYPSAKILLGLTLARLSAQSENLAETSLAVAQLREALAQDPDEAYWHKALAKLLHAQGNAEEAAKECAQAAKLSTDDSDLARGCGFGGEPGDRDGRYDSEWERNSSHPGCN
jgi:tetratricopeptide (TPR) repeat protein